MKKLFNLFYVLGICLIAGTFVACSDDDDEKKSSESLILEMTFDDPIVVKQPVIDGTNIKFYVAYNAIENDLKELVPAIKVSEKASVDPASGSKIDFSGDPVKFTVTAEDGTKSVYTASLEKIPSPEASILEITMAGEAVLTQPVIDGLNITFFVDGIDPTLLEEIIPTIEISSNATIEPASGSKVDFTNGTVVFTVTAQDGETETKYNVIAKQASTREKYDFEEWEEEGTETINGVKTPYYLPIGGWGSSNKGAATLIKLNKTDQFVVTETNDAYSGNAAARLETILSNNLDGSGSSLYPVVTSGSLFLGTFSISLDVLTSTKFGIIYDKKPITVRGYYKYTPGSDFYRSSTSAKNKVTLEENTKDECSISAILYEVDGKDTPLNGKNAYTSDRLVAKAIFEGTEQANYTPFTLTMDYNQTAQYDPTKKYRFAIICSSSREGDTFSGAPGSVLYVDDIEVISE